MKIQFKLLLISLVFATGCGEDPLECDDSYNAVIDNACYWGNMIDYNVVGSWAEDGQLIQTYEETIRLEFRGGGPDFIMEIKTGDVSVGADGQPLDDPSILTTGTVYTSDSHPGTFLLEDGFSGNDLSVTISKVDRTNKLISGTFTWGVSRQNSDGSFVNETVKGEFTDLQAGISEK